MVFISIDCSASTWPILPLWLPWAPMARTIRLILLGLLVAGIAFLVLKLRSSRAPESSLDAGVPLTGSLDTWPDVPEKNIA